MNGLGQGFLRCRIVLRLLAQLGNGVLQFRKLRSFFRKFRGRLRILRHLLRQRLLVFPEQVAQLIGQALLIFLPLGQGLFRLRLTRLLFRKLLHLFGQLEFLLGQVGQLSQFFRFRSQLFLFLQEFRYPVDRNLILELHLFRVRHAFALDVGQLHQLSRILCPGRIFLGDIRQLGCHTRIGRLHHFLCELFQARIGCRQLLVTTLQVIPHPIGQAIIFLHPVRRMMRRCPRSVQALKNLSQGFFDLPFLLFILLLGQ